MIKQKQTTKIVVVALLCGILAGGVLLFGYYLGSNSIAIPGISQVINRDANQPEEVDFSVFWQVWNQVHDNYIDSDKLNDKDLVEGAIAGMVEAIDDPFSVFMPASEAKRFSQDLDGSFGGIGIRIEMKDQQLTITSPLTDTPAERAGLLPGDVIVKIDGQATEDMNFEDMVAKIRGEIGTEVSLSVYRAGSSRLQIFDVTREEIVVKSVEYELNQKNNIGIIKITQFGSDTTQLLKAVAADIKEQQPDGLILDLRNNPGGYLDTSVEVASIFIEDGLIVKQTGQDETEYKAQGRALLISYPLVVLVNNGSASASEIVAGAIRDYNQGLLVGEKTFGKGSVQDLAEFGQWGDLRLTVGRWQTPNGEEINHKGIQPDIKVKMNSKNIDTIKDIQIQRAIKELKNKK